MLLIYLLNLVKIQTKPLMSSLVWGQSFKRTVNFKKQVNCGAEGRKRCGTKKINQIKVVSCLCACVGLVEDGQRPSDHQAKLLEDRTH